jgi:hypothetical protein
MLGMRPVSVLLAPSAKTRCIGHPFPGQQFIDATNGGTYGRNRLNTYDKGESCEQDQADFREGRFHIGLSDKTRTWRVPFNAEGLVQ